MNKTILSAAILAVMGAGAGGYLYLENEKAKVESQAKLEQMEAELKAKADAVLEAQQAALQAQAVIGEQQKALEEAKIKAEVEAQEKAQAQAQAQTQAQVEAQSAPVASEQAVPVVAQTTQMDSKANDPVVAPVAKAPTKIDVFSPELKQGILFELKASDALDIDEGNNYSKLKPGATFARVVSTDGKLNIPKFRDESKGVAYYKLGDKSENANSTMFSASFSAKESGLIRIVTGSNMGGYRDDLCKVVNGEGDSIPIDNKDYYQTQTLKMQANAGESYRIDCKKFGAVSEQLRNGYTVKIEQKVGDEWSTQNLFYKPVTEGIATVAPDLDSEQKARFANGILVLKQSDNNGSNRYGYNGSISNKAFDESNYDIKELAKSTSDAFSNENGFNKLIEFGVVADKPFELILVGRDTYQNLSQEVIIAKKQAKEWKHAKEDNIYRLSNTFSMRYDVVNKGVYPVRIFIDGRNVGTEFKVFILREGDTQATQLKMSDVYIRASDKDKFKTVDKKNAPADMM